MDAAWTNAAIPSDSIVFRLRLRPYSYGHELILHHLGSPLVVDAPHRPITAVDLLIASIICSQTYEGALSLIHSPLRLSLFVRVWRWMFCKRIEFYTELRAFFKYRAAGRWQPPTNRQLSGRGTTRTPKAPAAAHILVFLQETLGMSEAEAFDLPMSRAHLYYFAHADAQGKIDLSIDGEFDLLKKTLADAEAKGDAAWDF